VHKTVSCSKNVHTLQISCNRLLAPTVNFHDFVIKLSKSDSRLVKNKTLPATTHINVTHTDTDIALINLDTLVTPSFVSLLVWNESLYG